METEINIYQIEDGGFCLACLRRSLSSKSKLRIGIAPLKFVCIGRQLTCRSRFIKHNTKRWLEMV